MKRIRIVISIGLLIVATSCSRDYKKITQGVEVSVSANGNTFPLQVQFISDDIIKIVNAGNADSSLIISDYKKNVHVDIQKLGDTVVLNSSKLVVKISITNGQVMIYNLQGELLLNQQTYDSEDSSSSVIHFVKQFDDERLFGLGQHQKGSYEVTDDYIDLFQSNMEAVSPFVLSNKGYALLFDDYSQAQFGNLNRKPVNINA